MEYMVLAAGELNDLVRIFKLFQADGAIRLVIRKFDVVKIEFCDALNVLSDSIADLRGLQDLWRRQVALEVVVDPSQHEHRYNRDDDANY